MLAPLTISHRACQGHAPENTLAGIRAAIAFGVDAIEIDVQTSRDGVPVLLHDETVDRTTGGAGRVHDLTLEQIKALDAGRGFDDRFAGERVPTLAEALELTRDACLLVVEIKQRAIEPAVADVIRRFNAAAASMVWSFHAEVVAAIRTLLPEVPAAQLWSGLTGDRSGLLDGTVRRGAQAVSVHHGAVDEALVRAARLRGLTVYTWTADLPDDQARVAACGVGGVCTNYPDVLAATLAGAGYRPTIPPRHGARPAAPGA
jgi:glycerophosphoryl diester phosphodiesterase